MHDLLYENQSAWASASDPLPSFKSYAQSLGLNSAKFGTDYASDAVNSAINADMNAFAKTGDEMATPTFYLNGQKLSNLDLVDTTGQPTLAKFSAVIDTILAGKKYTPSATPQ
jgi:protein-disulfide isomerase